MKANNEGKEYRWELEKGNKKFRCPACQQKTLVRFVETNGGTYSLPDHFGRCDREVKCGYFQKPTKFEITGFNYLPSPQRQPAKRVQPKQVFIPLEELQATLEAGRYSNNSFTDYLLKRAPYPFPAQQVQRAVELYYIGTTPEGFTTFPYIDNKGRVQAVQAIKFDSANHREAASFLHKLLEADYKKAGSELPSWIIDYNKNERKVGCLFGEHLLSRYPSNPVAIVEAPKTAIYSSLYFGFPETFGAFLWLGAYNLSGLTADRCQALRGREVVLFPDLSESSRAFNLWNERAAELSVQLAAVFKVSNFLEELATNEQRQAGLDLADFLIQTDWNQYQPKTIEAQPQQPVVPATSASVASVASAAEKQLIEITAPLSYSDRVFQLLLEIRVGKPLVLSEVVKPENMERFKDIAKFFIRNDVGRTRGFYIEFTNDYSALRKFTY